MQTRFTHIVNNLNALGKVIDNEQQISKVMRCLTREWQPKITVIAESKDLGSMSIATLFGKLRQHELELHRLSEAEQTDRKRKGLSLKVQAHQTKSEQEICTDDSNSETDEDSELGLLVIKFKKFLKKKDSKSRKPSSSKTHDSKITCFECGKTRHIKSECFQLQNRNKTSKAKGNQPPPKTRKAYIAWNDNDEEGWKQIWKVKTPVLETNHPGPNLNWVCFTSQSCIIEHKENKDIRLVGDRVNNIYMLDFNALPASTICCLLSNSDENWLWHKRVAHIHMDHLNKLVSKQLVLGLPNRKFTKDKLCDSCEKNTFHFTQTTVT
ncbi:uncharacterized protein [Cicer arietinum]|uniref:uncharacterized protein n=1 Tax=Cicer arietinum TaxID=3827 RepID=UPI003CC6B65A